MNGRNPGRITRPAAGGCPARDPARRASPIARQPYSSRRLSYAALLVAAGLTGVYAETIPNFEVLTLVVFCAGVLLGARDGALVGGVSMLLYSLLNPYGPAPPLVTAAQVVGSAAAGVAGAMFAAAGLPRGPAGARAGVLALAAIGITAFFDLITNVATGLVYGQMKMWLIGGIAFSLWHIGTNVALFVVLGTTLTAVFARYAERLSV
ncbi:MAG: hypothetical protein HY076_07260 [Candidatus Eisenbacteria bacterium]|uniref:ECF transporter S component n=1 Tax=Eiseniibacteriota bacterium TaxID=2212470 RepID=A0A9D6LAL6_UNCEI|nr:hypothetical protein [Candidatus Eisenbacteria bacterium]MBI3540055.1 hypothetical protein [Candidatus Eisenbacteria bacterium]